MLKEQLQYFWGKVKSYVEKYVDLKVGASESAIVQNTVPRINSLEENNFQLIQDMYYKNNETYTSLTTEVFPGIITSSSKDVFLKVNVPKSLKNIKSIVVSSVRGGIRHANGGYIDGNDANFTWTGSSGYTFSAVKTSDTTIKLGIAKSTAFQVGSSTATNNCPVNGLMSITLTFKTT